MKVKLLLFYIFSCGGSVAFSQQAAVVPPSERPLTLRERYQELKSSSETYEQYKVIKEHLLDREWKIFNDSILAFRTSLKDANAEVVRLEAQLERTQDSLRARIASIQPLEIAGSHIAFLGMDINKSVFISIVLITLGALLAMIGLISWRMKSVQDSLNDRVEVINDLNHEFEEHRRNALEKQTKLSRELQNERNKLMETRKPEGSGRHS